MCMFYTRNVKAQRKLKRWCLYTTLVGMGDTKKIYIYKLRSRLRASGCVSYVQETIVPQNSSHNIVNSAQLLDTFINSVSPKFGEFTSGKTFIWYRQWYNTQKCSYGGILLIHTDISQKPSPLYFR